MLLESTGTSTKLSGGAAAPSHFKIEKSPTLFTTLSSGLYNDKVRATQRELSCNAWDAMVAAGKRNEPFEVHLPTQFEPYFSVVDFGTGLRFIKGGCETCHGTGIIGKDSSSELYCDECDRTGDYDAVKRLYCTYFASDKQASNDAIGGFGLGSKSPFAYTNSRVNGTTITGGFTVTNHYNGVTYFYTAFVGEDGYPDVRMDTQCETPDVPNGVEVVFPVDPRDIWEFENKAKSVFEFFEPRPKFNKEIEIHTPTYSVKTVKWGMRTNANTTQGNGLRAIMGNVQYTVGNIDISRLSESQQKLVTMPIDLFFTIGELKPAASREALQLDGGTIANILKSLDVVQNDLMSEIKKQVDACKTAWEARLKIHELTMQSGIGGLVNDAYNKGMLDGKYKTFKLHGTKVKVNELDYSNITVVEFRYNDRAKRKAKKENVFEYATGSKHSLALQDVAADPKKKADYDVKFDVNSDAIFVIHDLTKGKADKYVNYMLQVDSTNDYGKAIVISTMAPVGFKWAMEDAVTLLDKLGNPPFVRVSDLKAKYDPLMKEEKEAKPRVPREKMNVRVLKTYLGYSRRGSNGWTRAWEKADDAEELSDTSVTKFYILTENGDGGISSGFYNARTCVDFYNKVRRMSMFGLTGPIYGIKKGSKLLTDPSFVPVRPFVEAKLKAIMTPAKEMELSLSAKPFSSEWTFVLDYIGEHPQVLLHDSPIRQFALSLKAAKIQDKSGNEALVEIAGSLGHKINNVADYNLAWNNVIKLYPMLNVCVRKWWSDGTIEEKTAIVEYLRLVEEQRKAKLILTEVQVTEEEEETVNA